MNIPTSDDAIIALLKLALGGEGFLLVLALPLWSLYGWYSTAKDAAERVRQLSDIAGKAHGALRRNAAGVILIVLFQGFWLITAYFVGNFISVMFMYNKGINQSPGAPPPTVGQVLHALQFDAVSGTYTAIAVMGIIVSYRSALRGGEGGGVKGMGVLLALPGYAAVLFGGLFAVLVSLNFLLAKLGHDPWNGTKTLVVSLLAVLVGGGYAASCHFAMDIPQLVTRWRSSPDYHAYQWRTDSRRY
jgi:hypothetical protein